MKFLDHIYIAMQLIVNWRYFKWFRHYSEPYVFTDKHVNQSKPIYGLAFHWWAKNGMSPRELSSIEIHARRNFDHHFVDIEVVDSRHGETKINHLSTVEKGKQYQLTLHISYSDVKGKAIVEVEIRPIRVHNPQTLRYVMPCSGLGMKL